MIVCKTFEYSGHVWVNSSRLFHFILTFFVFYCIEVLHRNAFQCWYVMHWKVLPDYWVTLQGISLIIIFHFIHYITFCSQNHHVMKHPGMYVILFHRICNYTHCYTKPLISLHNRSSHVIGYRPKYTISFYFRWETQALYWKRKLYFQS